MEVNTHRRPDRSTSPLIQSSKMTWVYALLFFLLLAAALHVALDIERQKVMETQRTLATLHAASLRSRLEKILNENVFLANGLAAHVLTVPNLDPAKARAALKTVFESGSYIRNIGLAPDNRLTYLYPHEGNEDAIDLYYPDHQQQWPMVQRAIEKRKTVLAGPVKLVQGGRGFISRTPAFNDGGEYWGMLSVVLDADRILDALQSTDTGTEMVHALRGADGSGPDGAVFWGDAELFDRNPVTTEVSIPGGAWQLAVRPADGWQTHQRFLLFSEGAGLLAIVLFTALFVFYHKGRLQIAANERRLRAFLETTPDAVIVTDDSGIIQEYNPSAENLFGYRCQEMLGGSINRLMNKRDAAMHDRHLRAAANPSPHKMAGSREIVGQRKDGTPVPLEINVGLAQVDRNNIFVGVIRDISERKAFEKRLMELASTDGLTGAYNRRAFLDAANQTLNLAKRHGRGWSLLMIDADHFKRINDTHGHQIGDQVLQVLAKTMKKCLREGDVLGRFGGEEFAVALPETDNEQAELLAKRLLEAVRKLRIKRPDGKIIQITISIGIASLGNETEDLDTLTKQADDALYAAKADGRDCYCSGVDISLNF